MFPQEPAAGLPSKGPTELMPSVLGQIRCAAGPQEARKPPAGLDHPGVLPKESQVWAELPGMSRAGIGKNKGRTFQKGEME